MEWLLIVIPSGIPIFWTLVFALWIIKPEVCVMYNDTISDFLTRLRNASMAGKLEVPVRSSKAIVDIAGILKTEGFIASVSNEDNQLTIILDKDWPITHIKRLSKPGVRLYVKTDKIPRPRGGTG